MEGEEGVKHEACGKRLGRAKLKGASPRPVSMRVGRRAEREAKRAGIDQGETEGAMARIGASGECWRNGGHGGVIAENTDGSAYVGSESKAEPMGDGTEGQLGTSNRSRAG